MDQEFVVRKSLFKANEICDQGLAKTRMVHFGVLLSVFHWFCDCKIFLSGSEIILFCRSGTVTADEDAIQVYKPDGLVHTLDLGDDEESVCPRWCPAIWTRYTFWHIQAQK